MKLSKRDQALLSAFDKGFATNQAHASRLAARVRSRLFDKQLAFLDDPSRFRTLVVGRRGGKTTGLSAAHLIDALTAPNITSLTIHKSRASQSAEAFKSELRTLMHENNVPFREDKPMAEFHLPNQSKIILRGSETIPEIDKLRGGKWRLVSFDEAASLSPRVAEFAFDEVVYPGLSDYKGAVVYSGTPGHALAGPFYDFSTGHAPGWSNHHWDMRDNPHIPDPQEQMDELRTMRGWSLDHPIFMREWLGLWVHDPNGLVFPYDRAKNVAAALPEARRWYYTLSVDIGYNDPCGFSVGCWSFESPNSYITKSYRKQHLTPDEVGEEIMGLKERYPFTRIIMDTQGAGKGYQKAIERRFKIHIEPAEKREKRNNIELMAGDMLSGRVKALEGECADLIEEWQQIGWNEDRSAPDEKYLDDCAHSALYLYRDMQHYRGLTESRQAPEKSFADRILKAAKRHKENVMRPKPKRSIYVGFQGYGLVAA